MNAKKKKSVFIVIAIIVIVAIAFGIYWKATEHDRFIKGKMNDILEDISDYRSGEDTSLSLWIYSETLEDQKFVDFLVSEVTQMCENDELGLLKNFLQELEYEDAYLSEVLNVVGDYFENADTLDSALKMKDILKYLDYYNSQFILNRNSGLISNYIDENGTEPISTIPGTGYYANAEDSSTHERVGIQGSPLYDATSITHYGDFRFRREYGVHLNSYYEETSYSHESWHFRDNYISFSPEDGDCVCSGDYLFCFSADGNLVGFCELEKE